MGRRCKDDPIDALCRTWGETRRKLLGLDEPKLAREYIGALKSTLGQRRDLHAGAKSEGRVSQHCPEVYVGEARLVNQAYQSMAPEFKIVMDVHYAAHAPADVKAEFLCMSPKKYWHHVGYVRMFVMGWLAKTDAA